MWWIQDLHIQSYQSSFFSLANNQDYSDCREAGGTVVSNVFCLPTNYRKDVLPPTGTVFSRYNFSNLFCLPYSSFIPFTSKYWHNWHAKCVKISNVFCLPTNNRKMIFLQLVATYHIYNSFTSIETIDHLHPKLSSARMQWPNAKCKSFWQDSHLSKTFGSTQCWFLQFIYLDHFCIWQSNVSNQVSESANWEVNASNIRNNLTFSLPQILFSTKFKRRNSFRNGLTL